MAMAITLREYLKERGSQYDVSTHTQTGCSMETAAVAHIPGDQLLKSVILKDDKGYVMAVIPSTYHVKVSELKEKLNRPLHLVSEDELAEVFVDCEIGAIPPIGQAYDMETIIDEKITDSQDVYFEAGDHKSLIHMSRDEFVKLARNSSYSEFSRHI